MPNREKRRNSHRPFVVKTAWARRPYASLVGLVLRWALLAGLGFAPASAAWAAPVSYAITGGSAVLSVSVGGTVLGTTVSPALSGTFTADSAAQNLTDLSIELAPNIIMNLSAAYGGYDTITIESAALDAEPGFSSTLLTSGASTYTVLASPLEVTGLWGGSHSGGGPPPVSNQPISYPVPSMIASLGISPMISISAVTLSSLDGSVFGEANDLVVVANLNVNSVTVIPEPGTGGLFALGLGGLWLHRRSVKSKTA
ncbi:MAG: PEP-CTERM sorting domain-containing protein [Myxococcota bacterium]|nr:PEP-CTERM sorting domain-containing protein [Myxococcota bacterium]